MAKYQHILLASDLSKANRAAAKAAAAIAQEHGSKLSLIHVSYIPAIYSIGFLSYEDIVEKLVNEAKPEVEAFMKDIGLTNCEPILVVGSAKDQILKAVKDRQVDLLVMGSHGEYGISEMAGSTVSAVVQYAPCNVLIVHANQ